MVRRNRKYYTTNPNKWINLLGKNGTVVFPITIFELKSMYDYKTDSPDSEYRIILKRSDTTYVGNKKLTSKNYIDTWYIALEYEYNKIKIK